MEEKLVVVYGKRGHASLRQLDETVTTVHVVDAVFLWLLELIAEKAPNVRVVQTAPSFYSFGPSAVQFCKDRSIEFREGFVSPQLAWRNNRMLTSDSYRREKAFLEHLSPDQTTKFEELIKFEC